MKFIKEFFSEFLELTKGVLRAVGRGAAKAGGKIADPNLWSGVGRAFGRVASKEFWASVGRGIVGSPGKALKLFEGVYTAIKHVYVTTQWIRVLQISACSLVAVMTVFGGAAILFKQESELTIGILPKSKEGDVAISLSETVDFANPTIALGAEGVENMSNISVDWLPDDLHEIDGVHNGEHYIAYTFYVKNTGDLPCQLTESFLIESAVKGADSAIRIRVYKNGECSTYARLGANGEPEEGTVPFESDEVAYTAVRERLETEEIVKYTLVIWLEGDDPECLDNIKGGNVRMSMTFSAEPLPDKR